LAALPSGTVTFLFTDIQESSRLWEQFPDSMPAAMDRHNKLLDEAIAANGGYVFSTAGDGRASAFATAGEAIAAALTAQQSLRTEEWGVTGPLRVRMGLHTGPAEERGGDYLGPTINRAARLMDVAHGGQVVCSKATAEVLGNQLPQGADLIDLGQHRLRDLARPEHVLQLAHPTLRRDFRPLRSLDARQTNLPVQTTTFIGRERQLAGVTRALEADRVVTLTGVGGVGKTRLAVQIGGTVLPRYRDGVWLVELAPIADPTAVVEVVSSALGVPQRQGLGLQVTILDFLRAKELLLLLDNCEHLIEAAARVVDEVVRFCPQVRVLATSRERLGVSGERVIAVPGLELPGEFDADGDALREVEALHLFVERAAAAKAGFTLTEKNQASVVQICRRLDGIPLAIELAAARVRSLTPTELAQRLDERFHLLTSGPRTVAPRHQTLRRAIDWSYELLTEAEQRALNRSAVFAGDFGLDAAEAVIGGDGIDIDDVVNLLARLVDKSLVSAEDRDDSTRYRVFETIRQYAHERLEAAGAADVLSRRHAEHFVAFATEAGVGLRTAEEASWSIRVEADLDNLRGALAWSVKASDPDLALGLVAPLALTRSVGYALVPWADTVLALSDATGHRLFPEVMAWAGWAAVQMGDVERGVQLTHGALELTSKRSLALGARSLCHVYSSAVTVAGYAANGEEAGRLAEDWLVLARSLRDDYEIASALLGSATPFMFAGDVVGALARFDEAMGVARRLGNPTMVSFAAVYSAFFRIDTDAPQARQLFDEALRAATSVGNHLATNLALVHSAYLYLEVGDWREAARRLLQAAEEFHRLGDSNGVRQTLVGAVPALAMAGADEVAVLTYGAATASTPTTGNTLEARFVETVPTLRQRVADDDFAAWAARGAALDDNEVVALIRDEFASLLIESTSEPRVAPPRDATELQCEGGI
jgi:predicted ATPase/class 3 adenylate cyclase